MSVRILKTGQLCTIDRVHIRGYDLILYMTDGSNHNADLVEVV